MTFPPRTGLYLLSSFSEPIASVPYKASYKLPHLAFAAFKAYLAFEIGTTNWGPGVFDISSSTFYVWILKFFPSFFK